MKVLFVGNSHTFTHSVPSIINGLFMENKMNWEYKEMTVSGETLKFHSNRAELLKEIEFGNYDIIVLQERASNFNVELFKEGFSSLYNHIKNKSNTKILMYEIWSNESRPEVQKIINDAYVWATKNDKVELAPAGVAWDIIRHNHKDIVLYMDGNHATKIGAYLASLSIFYALNKFTSKLNIDEKSIVINDLELDINQVNIVNEKVWEVYNYKYDELDKYVFNKNL